MSRSKDQAVAADGRAAKGGATDGHTAKERTIHGCASKGGTDDDHTVRDDIASAALLGDLAQDGIDLFCWCNQCHHNATVAIGRLLARFGPACTVPKVGSRMCCSSCGSKDVATRPAWPSPGQIARYWE